MTPERWQQIKGVLDQVLELKPPQRPAFLHRVCDGDHSLQREVESLLAGDSDGKEGFLAKPRISATITEDETRSWVGRRIGPYEVLEMIGEGGMGSVYRAARADEQYKKQVAIKVVKRGLETPFALARFRAERQILANLEHSNIARMLEGGTTESGLPYVVMEMVDGVPIDKYCEAHTLSIEARLRLFRTVCLAVQHAHQHLTVHRDLKPGNILVTADGTPKLLDFGIAKILDPESLPGGAEATISFLRLLTPEYASPEQVRGDAITTASDIYSLGVVLFRLLTGHHPYVFDSRSPDAIARVICDTEPPKPSTVVRLQDKSAPGRATSQLDETRTIGAGYESTRALSRRLQGDLDNIVLMALRKEPQRRYPSAEQFAEDVRRHLESMPVVARNNTVEYRVSKFVARHKAGTAATVVAIVFLLVALVVALYEAGVARRQAEIAREQRTRAEKRFNDVRHLANSLLFDLHDAIQDLPGSTPARKLLVEKSLGYLDNLSAESSDDVGLLRELATAYERVGELQGHYLANNLGETSNSLVSYQKALNIRRRLSEQKSAEWQDRLRLAEIYRRTAVQMIAVGNARSALESIQSATTITESMATLKSDDANVLYELAEDYRVRGHIQSNGFFASQNDLVAAQGSFNEARAIDERILATDPNSINAQRSVADDALFLANTETDLDQRSDALDNYVRSLRGFVSVSQLSNAIKDQRKVAVVYNHLAIFYDAAGNVPLTLANYQKGLSIYKKLAVQDPRNVLLQQGLAIAYVNVGDAEARLGNSAGGFADMYQGLTIMKTILNADPNAEQRSIVAQMHISLANNLAGTRRFPEAGREYGIALHIFEDMHPDSNDVDALTYIAACEVGIADAQRRSRDLRSAAANFQAALTLTKPRLNSTDHGPLHNAADAYAGLGNIESAWALQSPLNERRAHWEKAVRWYQHAVEMWDLLPPFARVESNRFRAAEVKKCLQEAESELDKR
jgi:eukaryotic-like serine/threonine-protein kinase